MCICFCGYLCGHLCGHLCSAVQTDAVITGFHDGVHCLISLVILAAYTYYYSHSCTDQSKPNPAADESGSDGLETVTAILESSIFSCLTTAYRYITKYFQNDGTQRYIGICYVLIIIFNVIIMVFALCLRYVGVC